MVKSRNKNNLSQTRFKINHYYDTYISKIISDIIILFMYQTKEYSMDEQIIFTMVKKREYGNVFL